MDRASHARPILLPTVQPLDSAPADRARLLLRKLRDLNLHAARIEINADYKVRLEGCLSLDAPVESGLRYRLVDHENRELVLELRLEGSGLSVERRASETDLRFRQHVPLHGEKEGPLTITEWQARIEPEDAGPREVEHFLRRAVRGTYRTAG